MKYIVVVEKSKTGLGAYVPDLPGCVATATTRARVTSLIRKAVVVHIHGLIEDGIEVPKPIATASTITMLVACKRQKAA
jgi:predicted RNase H-like HicB family nuclease